MMKITLAGAEIPKLLPSLGADLFYACRQSCDIWIWETIEAMGKLNQKYLEAVIAHSGVNAQVHVTAQAHEAFSQAEVVVYMDSCQPGSRFQMDREALMGQAEGATGLSDQARLFGGLEGLMMALRTGEKALAVCETMARACPKAKVVNLSQSLAQISYIFDQKGFEVVGLDGGPYRGENGLEGLLQLLGLKSESVLYQTAGLNQYAWLTKLTDTQTGRDLMPKAKTLVKKGGWGLLKARWLDWYDAIAIGANHSDFMMAQPDAAPLGEPQLSETIQARKERILAMNTIGEKGLNSQEGGLAQVSLLAKAPAYRPGQCLSAWLNETALELPAGVQKNNGLLPQLPPWAMVEAPILWGRPSQPIYLMETLVDNMALMAHIQALSAQAAGGDRQALRDVIEQDPALEGLDRLYCQDVIQGLIELNQDVLPRL